MTVIRPNSIAGISSIFALGDQVQFLKADGMPAGVSIAGTVTFDDVTNVDSIGIVTARAGVNVGNPTINATISPNGDANFLGSVGIGTALPTSNLEVHRGTITLNATTSSDTTKLRWNYQGTEYQYIERDNANGGLAFGDNTSEQMRIDSSGRLGVGVSSPYAKLEVHDGVTSTTLSDPITIFSGTSYTANGLYGIGFHYSADSSGTAPVFIGYEPTAGAGNTKGNLVFGTRDTTTAGDAPSKRMVIDSSGNLLVGTTSAALGTSGRGLIETNGTTTAINALKVNGTSTAYFGTSATGAELAAQTSIPLKFLTNNQERMTIDSSGNIGIGTALPGNKLSVSKAGAESFDINPGSVANNNIILHYNWSGANYVTAETRAAEHVFEIGTSEAMRIDSSGRLLLNSGTDVRIELGTTGTTGTNDRNHLRGDGANLKYNTASGGVHVFEQNGSEAMRIDSSGRLLVGTTSTSDASTQILQGYYPGGSAEEAILKLQRGTASPGTNATLGSIQFASSAGRRGAEIFSQRDGGTWTDGSSHPGLLTFATTADGASSPTPRMTIDSSGVLKIGQSITDEPAGNNTRGAAISGTGVLAACNTGARAIEAGRTEADAVSREVLRWFRNGSLVQTITTTATTVSYPTGSDYRLKENVVNMTGAIDRVKNLSPKRFNFIAEPGVEKDGFIAHELETVVPQAVVGTKDQVDENGNPVWQGVDHSFMVPLLTGALQEAIAKIETLEAEVAALKAA